MGLSKLSLGDRIIGVTGGLLVLDLLLLPWHHFGHVFGHPSPTAVQSPNSFWGILGLLVTLAVLALLGVSRFTAWHLPDLPFPVSRVVFVATVAVLVILLVKLLASTTSLTVGAFLAVVLAAGLVYGGFLGDGEARDAR